MCESYGMLPMLGILEVQFKSIFFAWITVRSSFWHSWPDWSISLWLNSTLVSIICFFTYIMHKSVVRLAKNVYHILQYYLFLGAIDGKHIRIKAPANSGSEFFNYKNFFSIILLAICDANYRFILVDIGDSGRHSDGEVFSNSRLGKLFDRNKVYVPAPCSLPGSTFSAPFVLVGDDAFPLKHYIMKPWKATRRWCKCI